MGHVAMERIGKNMVSVQVRSQSMGGREFLCPPQCTLVWLSDGPGAFSKWPINFPNFYALWVGGRTSNKYQFPSGPRPITLFGLASPLWHVDLYSACAYLPLLPPPICYWTGGGKVLSQCQCKSLLCHLLGWEGRLPWHSVSLACGQNICKTGTRLPGQRALTPCRSATWQLRCETRYSRHGWGGSRSHSLSGCTHSTLPLISVYW